jgi:sRNA-binding carbon storage regulator CsrA
MLVLSRKKLESIVIGRGHLGEFPSDLDIAVVLTILDVVNNRVVIGFIADKKTPIHRKEIWDKQRLM